MRLLTPALGVWVAEGCREPDGGGLGCLGAGLNVGKNPGLPDTTCGLTLFSCQLPNDLGGVGVGRTSLF